MNNELNEIENIRKGLKKVETKEPKIEFNKYVGKEKLDSIKTQFFDSGCQNWYDLISHLTFKTYFIDLSIENAKAIVNEHKNYIKLNKYDNDILQGLEGLIDTVIKENHLNKVFIKLSTRSPKDSPIIFEKATKEFINKLNKDIHATYEEKFILLSQCVQDNFYTTNGKEAIDLFVTSERIYEDLTYSLENEEEYSKFNIQIVIREWDQAIPIENEFRAFVMDRNLNAIGQYYYIFCFKGLAEKANVIKENLLSYFNEKLKPILPDILKDCIVDFVYTEKEGDNVDIKVIEINPFDGFALASFAGSTGLFLLSEEKDKEVIQHGPLEIRVRETSLPEIDIRARVNKEYNLFLNKI
jgi:hypothetical protein